MAQNDKNTMKYVKSELRDILSIKPYHQNPRKNDGAIAPVMRSIELYGFNQPIIVDEKGVIIVGHTRYEAAKKLGLQMVPVGVVNWLSEAKKKGYRIIDNKTHEFAAWDYEMLSV